MQGLHLTADLYGCQGPPQLLVSEQALARLCHAQVQAAGLTPVADRWFSFPGAGGRPGGVTGALLLAESHLAVHTWPELGSVTLDVYVCNFSADNSQRAELLMQNLTAAFAPARVELNRLRRGLR